MNTLLVFFSFPIAVIIFSIVLQKLLQSPLAVAAIIFAIFIVVTFAAFDETFLIATLVYTILAFLSALLVEKLNNENDISDDDIDTYSTTSNTKSSNDDNILENHNCGFMYNRRCRKF